MFDLFRDLKTQENVSGYLWKRFLLTFIFLFEISMLLDLGAVNKGGDTFHQKYF